MIVKHKAEKRYEDAGNHPQEVDLVEYTQLAFFVIFHVGCSPNGFYERPQAKQVLSGDRHIGGKFNRVECNVNAWEAELFPGLLKY
jgi:hypothetical protein